MRILPLLTMELIVVYTPPAFKFGCHTTLDKVFKDFSEFVGGQRRQPGSRLSPRCHISAPDADLNVAVGGVRRVC